VSRKAEYNFKQSPHAKGVYCIMYKRISAILFPIVTIALIFTAYWGYTEYQKRNKIMVKAENQYQRSFHNLSYHMDRLHEQLGSTLAMSSASTDSYRKGLMKTWQLTSEAKNEVSQLPLLGMEFSKTEQFLANLSNFSYQAGVRDLSKKPLTDKEQQTLNSLYKHSGELSKELRGMQAKVLATKLQWADVEMALASEKGPKDNMIVDGFQAMDKQVSGYKDVEWDPLIANMSRKNDGDSLQGKEVSADEVKNKAAKFWHIDPNLIQIVENGKGTKFHTYSANINNSSGGVSQMDFTSKGGHPFHFLNTREVGQPTYDVNQAVDIAGQFLGKHNYNNMTPISQDRSGNAADITFARKQNDVTIYPEKIMVKVALDNGEIVGVQATDYVYNHKNRELKQPQMDMEEVQKNLSDKMQVTSNGLAIILNDMKEDTQCYEFVGKLNNKNYRVFLNADTGAEERIEMLEPGEAAAAK
jgi:spore germination protein